VCCKLWCVSFIFTLHINPFVLHVIIVIISYFKLLFLFQCGKENAPFKCIFNWTIKFVFF
jgi:hypothetical protein